MAKKGPSSVADRLNRIEGQIRGVSKLVEAGESIDKIMAQLQAVISSLESVKIEMVKAQMKERIFSELDSVAALLK